MATTILTVDDSRTIRTAVVLAFEPYDCVVLEAEDGAQGLAVVEDAHPDLILLDYSMPVMDGHEMLRRLKANPGTKSIPGILLTAEMGREQILRMARLGARDYLVKPFTAQRVIERASQLVTLRPKVPSPAAPSPAREPAETSGAPAASPSTR